YSVGRVGDVQPVDETGGDLGGLLPVLEHEQGRFRDAGHEFFYEIVVLLDPILVGDDPDDIGDQTGRPAADHDRIGAELADRLRRIGLPRRGRVDQPLGDGDRHVLDRDAHELRLGDVELVLAEPFAQIDLVGAAG